MPSFCLCTKEETSKDNDAEKRRDSREEVDDREEVCITEIKSLTCHISYGSENGCQVLKNHAPRTLIRLSLHLPCRLTKFNIILEACKGQAVKNLILYRSLPLYRFES